ncbi:RidA family protein (plasmid) [Enterococcus sp. 22-H-5-01]|uniref:RidA family protein n=1 Tax=Enterococcus sp. 22-H-5-01 TaxID=3418555 RepID=UPI003D0893D4
MAIYSNSIVTDSPLLIISGQTPQKDDYIPEDITEQIELVVEKINTIILENHTNAKNIVKMNVYLTNADYLDPLRNVLSKFYGEYKPAMTLVIVAGLVHSKFKVEIDSIVAIK